VFCEIARCVAWLQPESGGCRLDAHNRVVLNRNPLSRSPRRRWPLVFVAIGGAIAVFASLFDLRINTTASMPIGLYREVPARLERGAWAVFCLPDTPARQGRERGYLRQGRCADGSAELVKQVVALRGDRVALSHDGLMVRGHALPDTALRATDRSGRVLEHTPYGERSVDADELWVLGLDPRVSWDSRYFGPVPLDHVRAGALPVLTLGSNLRPGESAGDPP